MDTCIWDLTHCTIATLGPCIRSAPAILFHYQVQIRLRSNGILPDKLVGCILVSGDFWQYCHYDWSNLLQYFSELWILIRDQFDARTKYLGIIPLIFIWNPSCWIRFKWCWHWCDLQLYRWGINCTVVYSCLRGQPSPLTSPILSDP